MGAGRGEERSDEQKVVNYVDVWICGMGLLPLPSLCSSCPSLLLTCRNLPLKAPLNAKLNEVFASLIFLIDCDLVRRGIAAGARPSSICES